MCQAVVLAPLLTYHQNAPNAGSGKPVIPSPSNVYSSVFTRQFAARVAGSTTSLSFCSELYRLLPSRARLLKPNRFFL